MCPVAPVLPLSFGVRVFAVSKGISSGLILSGWYGTRNILVLRVVSPQLFRWFIVSAFSQLELEPRDAHVASADIACFFYALRWLIIHLSSILFLEGSSPKAVYRLLLSWLVRARKGEFPADDIRSDPMRIEKALSSND